MRIGVNCFLLRKDMGGMRQYFLHLFRELLENDNTNQYTFFYFKHNIEELEHLGTSRWQTHAVLIEDQEEIRGHCDKMDVFFCPFGAYWPRPLPIPTVVTVYDIQEKYYPRFFSPRQLWSRKKYTDISIKIADQIITISEFSKNAILSFHRVAPQNVRVAHLFAHEAFGNPLKPLDDLRLPPLPENYIFFPANRWLHKNHDNLLKALVILEKEYKRDIACVFTGFDVDGGYPLTHKVNQYGLQDRVNVLGFVGLEELKHIYHRARLMCFPSLYEGFGMPILEAMRIGCPVVCADATSIPEVAGDAALYFNPHDPGDIAAKIALILDDDTRRQELVMRGKKRAAAFTVKQTAREHLEAFHTASESFSKTRYYFNKYLLEPFHTYRLAIAGRFTRSVHPPGGREKLTG